MKKDFLTLLDLSRDELLQMLERSLAFKRQRREAEVCKPLEGKSIGLIFEKRSTRTRLSFEVAIFELGAQAIYMSPDQMQISRGEPIKDTARVLSRYLDAIIVRNDSHRDLEELARWASVPVINALTNLYHPCQILSDLFTIQEAGVNIKKMKLCFIGDPNNVFNSWVTAAALLGFELRLASPKGWRPEASVVKAAQKIGRVKLGHFTDPAQAAKSADVLYTDVWVSMGQEKEAAKKRRAFKGFQINEKLLKAAGKKNLILHCLPAHRGEEITDQVMEDYAELIFTQAENRLHCQKAVLEFLVPGIVNERT